MRAVLIAASLLAASCSAAFAAEACPQVFKPVCAVTADGKRATYSNACFAGLAKATVLHEGSCEAGNVCLEIVKPVCAIDPKTGKERTYSNSCFAEMANAVWKHDGECTK